MEHIDGSLIIDLKNASDSERKEVISLFRKNYESLLKDMENEADYAKVDRYWTDFTPQVTPIMKASDFIEKYKTEHL